MPFQKGISGNPAGRPKGLVSKNQKLRDGLDKHVPGILNRLVELAMAGDVMSARLVLERTLPALKPVDVAAPAIGMASLEKAPNAVLEALAAGTLTPDQAASLGSVLASLVRVRESTELEERIRNLEARHGQP